jgi:hypothetical protein
VAFAGLTCVKFTAAITGIANEQGALLNGCQIIREPTAGLLLLGLTGLIRRR